MAAKRSRDARRMKENQIALRAGFLEKEVFNSFELSNILNHTKGKQKQPLHARFRKIRIKNKAFVCFCMLHTAQQRFQLNYFVL